MGKFNFKEDLKNAQQTQKRIAGKLALLIEGAEVMDDDGSKQYDIKLLHGNREVTFECKEDFRSVDTGNFFMEYACSDRPSGITTTTADFHVLTMATKGGKMTDYVIPTKVLREMIKECIYFRTDIPGGDNGNARGHLFKVQDIINNKKCTKF